MTHPYWGSTHFEEYGGLVLRIDYLAGPMQVFVCDAKRRQLHPTPFTGTHARRDACLYAQGVQRGMRLGYISGFQDGKEVQG